MNLDEVVCPCFNITNGMIKETVDSGASTLEQVQEITEAGTICGACRGDLQQLIDVFVAERDK